MTRREALEILGLESDASLDEAKKAYRALVKTYHPDKNTASNASVMFWIIQDAWEVIQNIAEEQRAAADIKQQQSAQEAAYEAAQRYRDEERYGYRKAEEERKKREAEEAANRKAEEERKRAEEERQRAEARAAQAEEIRRDKKEKKTEKVIKRFCYLGWFILTLVSALRIINDQNTVHLINIFYSISIVCLGTIGYGWLTGWLIIKC